MNLLCFFLLLLADTDLEHLLPGILECLMVVALNGVFHISIRVYVLRKDRHQRETLVTNRAERTKSLHVRDCHNIVRLSQIRRLCEQAASRHPASDYK
jgi:hypothetical protein